MPRERDEDTAVVEDVWEDAPSPPPRLSYVAMEEGAAPPTAPPAGRRPVVLPLLALVALAVAGTAGWLLWNLLRGAEETAVAGAPRAVPSVLGLEVDEAVDKLHDAGFTTEVRRRPSAEPEGTVVAQEPRRGARVELGRRVVVTASAGPPRVAAPDLTGLPLQEAVDRLGDAGLDARSAPVFSERPEGEVVGQRPAAGAKLKPGAAVTLRVSKGPRPTAVPEVVGLDATAARAALERAGMAARAVEVPGDEPAGTVVAQSPAAGSRAARGDAVRISVSAGPPPEAAPAPSPAPSPPRRLPDVLGLLLADAEAALAEAGFEDVELEEAEAASPDEDGVVLGQQPKPGARAKGEVVLLVGRWEE